MKQKIKLLVPGAVVVLTLLYSSLQGRAQQPGGNAPGSSAVAIPKVYDLKLAIDTALRKRPVLAAAEARSQTAKTGIAVAGAAYRPTMSSILSFNKTLAGDKGLVVTDGIATESVTTDPSYTTSMSLVVPIFEEGHLTFMTLPSERSAQAVYNAVRYREQETRSEVIVSVTEAFFSVLSAKEKVKASESQVKLHRQLVKNAQLKFEQKLIPRAEVLAAESSLVAAEADLTVARAEIFRSLRNFAANLGFDPLSKDVREIELVEHLEPLTTLDPLNDLLERAVGRHPSVLSQQASVAEATAKLELVKTERYPTFQATGTIGMVDDFAPPLDTWSARTGLSFRWNVFDFGALSLEIKQQTEALRAEERVLDQVKNEVSKSVIAAYYEFSNVRSQILLEKKRVDYQEEVARAAQERFKQNLIPMSELLEADANLTSARMALQQVQYNLRVQHAKLTAAVGAQ